MKTEFQSAVTLVTMFRSTVQPAMQHVMLVEFIQTEIATVQIIECLLIIFAKTMRNMTGIPD